MKETRELAVRFFFLFIIFVYCFKSRFKNFTLFFLISPVMSHCRMSSHLIFYSQSDCHLATPNVNEKKNFIRLNKGIVLRLAQKKKKEKESTNQRITDGKTIGDHLNDQFNVWGSVFGSAHCSFHQCFPFFFFFVLLINFYFLFFLFIHRSEMVFFMLPILFAIYFQFCAHLLYFISHKK